MVAALPILTRRLKTGRAANDAKEGDRLVGVGPAAWPSRRIASLIS
ncbi:hypothetical protein BQ8794_10018 [Mesorhizobium prunaredense]|uniref:Uncharacterized protein n=1 Tax=Mesorhizobium prunaredense TaxID=1631249 RepID=A0A1R3UYD4_9HYPH|nr:hypothetical protein BQ8794_10018 [Mesorhizobium prunaredense]